MLTARQLKIIKLIMNNPGIHGKEISENLYPHVLFVMKSHL